MGCGASSSKAGFSPEEKEKPASRPDSETQPSSVSTPVPPSLARPAGGGPARALRQPSPNDPGGQRPTVGEAGKAGAGTRALGLATRELSAASSSACSDESEEEPMWISSRTKPAQSGHRRSASATGPLSAYPDLSDAPAVHARSQSAFGGAVAGLSLAHRTALYDNASFTGLAGRAGSVSAIRLPPLPLAARAASFLAVAPLPPSALSAMQAQARAMPPPSLPPPQPSPPVPDGLRSGTPGSRPRPKRTSSVILASPSALALQAAAGVSDERAESGAAAAAGAGPVSLPRAHSPETRGPAGPARERGVSLQFLIDFCADVPEDLPTWQLVSERVVPATGGRGCALVDTLEPGHSGPCEFLVSHSWMAPFCQLVRYLALHLAGCGEAAEPELEAGAGAGAEPAAGAAAGGAPMGGARRRADQVFLWLDVFCVPQHTAPSQAPAPADGAPSLDLGRMEDVVRQCGQTLLCLDRDASALRRTWCLYESWLSMQQAGGPHKLVVLSYDTTHEALAATCTSLDFEASDTSLAADKDRLMAAVRAASGEGGTREASAGVRAGLLAASRVEAEAALSQLHSARRWGRFRHIHQVLMKHVGLLGAHGRDVEAHHWRKLAEGVDAQWLRAHPHGPRPGPPGARPQPQPFPHAWGSTPPPSDPDPTFDLDGPPDTAYPDPDSVSGAVNLVAGAVGAGPWGPGGASLPAWHWSAYPLHPGLRTLLAGALAGASQGKADHELEVYRDAVAQARWRCAACAAPGAASALAGARALELAGCRLRLAVLLATRGEAAQALEEGGPAVEAFARHCGAASLTHASAAVALAAACKNTRDSAALRVRLLAAGHSAQAALLGPEHPTALETMREQAEAVTRTGDLGAATSLFRRLGTQLSRGVDLAEAEPEGPLPPDVAAARLGSRALQTWSTLLSYLGSMPGREEEVVALSRALIPARRRDNLRTLRAALVGRPRADTGDGAAGLGSGGGGAGGGSESLVAAAAAVEAAGELRRLGPRLIRTNPSPGPTPVQPPNLDSNADHDRQGVDLASGLDPDSAPKPDGLDAWELRFTADADWNWDLDLVGCSDPDDWDADLPQVVGELVAWSSALARMGDLEGAVRLQWRIAALHRAREAAGCCAPLDIELPWGKYKMSDAYEQGHMLFGVAGAAELAAEMLAKRQAATSNATTTSSPTAASVASNSGVDLAAAARPATALPTAPSGSPMRGRTPSRRTRVASGGGHPQQQQHQHQHQQPVEVNAEDAVQATDRKGAQRPLSAERSGATRDGAAAAASAAVNLAPACLAAAGSAEAKREAKRQTGLQEGTEASAEAKAAGLQAGPRPAAGASVAASAPEAAGLQTTRHEPAEARSSAEGSGSQAEAAGKVEAASKAEVAGNAKAAVSAEAVVRVEAAAARGTNGAAEEGGEEEAGEEEAEADLATGVVQSHSSHSSRSSQSSLRWEGLVRDTAPEARAGSEEGEAEAEGEEAGGKAVAHAAAADQVAAAMGTAAVAAAAAAGGGGATAAAVESRELQKRASGKPQSAGGNGSPAAASSPARTAPAPPSRQASLAHSAPATPVSTHRTDDELSPSALPRPSTTAPKRAPTPPSPLPDPTPSPPPSIPTPATASPSTALTSTPPGPTDRALLKPTSLRASVPAFSSAARQALLAPALSASQTWEPLVGASTSPFRPSVRASEPGEGARAWGSPGALPPLPVNLTLDSALQPRRPAFASPASPGPLSAGAGYGPGAGPGSLDASVRPLATISSPGGRLAAMLPGPSSPSHAAAAAAAASRAAAGSGTPGLGPRGSVGLTGVSLRSMAQALAGANGGATAGGGGGISSGSAGGPWAATSQAQAPVGPIALPPLPSAANPPPAPSSPQPPQPQPPSAPLASTSFKLSSTGPVSSLPHPQPQPFMSLRKLRIPPPVPPNAASGPLPPLRSPSLAHSPSIGHGQGQSQSQGQGQGHQTLAFSPSLGHGSTASGLAAGPALAHSPSAGHPGPPRPSRAPSMEGFASLRPRPSRKALRVGATSVSGAFTTPVPPPLVPSRASAAGAGANGSGFGYGYGYNLTGSASANSTPRAARSYSSPGVAFGEEGPEPGAAPRVGFAELNARALEARAREDWPRVCELGRQMLEVQQQTHGLLSSEAADAGVALAKALMAAGRRPEAEAELRRALGLQEALLGGSHPALGYTLKQLSLLVEDPAEAEQLNRRAAAVAS
ncbi:hypothetical protein HYH03_011973 [Edaphochlamys debaryana]|uniref:Uncharacterized protein n=1 Tax=Edaphochlamys debaryana TaxID=47281 RepID=A0A836BUZ3_9CHLO|nr:hypothetical protein HYH03_011973 [Edaphochlamys debaryana]|eukprot:KAG2489522.1 hypothetical protein HYH03_011973 [Edaphochlamys debaryana]